MRALLRMWHFRISLLVWLSLVAAPALGQEAPVSGVRLSFVRTENAASCIAAPALQREISRRMRHDPFEGAARQWIEGTIERKADYFEVQLFERDADGNTLGSRRLREQTVDCHKLDDAIVLAIALIIDPTAHLAPPSATEPGAAPGTVGGIPNIPATSPTPQAHPAAPQAGPESRIALEPMRLARAETTPEKAVSVLGRAFVAMDATVIHGVLPGFAFGAELLTRMALDNRGRFALRLSALVLPEKHQTTDAGDLGYSLTAMEAGGCFQSRLRYAIGFGCVGFGLGSVHSVVHNPEPFKPDDRLWAAFRLEAGGAVRIAGPVWLEARLFDLVAPRLWEFRVVENPRTSQATQKTAFKQNWLMPGAALGLGLHFD